MKKLFIIFAVVLVASGFTKQDIIANTDEQILNNFKKELEQVKSNQKPPKWAIFQAIKENDFNAVKALIKQGVDVNDRDWASNTPLMIAAEAGYYRIFQKLIKKINVNAKSYYDKTALSYALEKGNVKSADLLKQNGAK